MKDLEELVTTPTGRKWLQEAGPWADEKIRPSPRHDETNFTIQETRIEDCDVDPRKIVGTSHASYNQGMTWRKFLAYGNRIKTKLDVLETKPEYYDDPKEHATDSEPWHLVEINGELYTSIGNHRSVVAKFRAHEEGRVKQRVWSVDRLVVSDTAKRQYDELQAEYLPGESDRGPERELIGKVGSSKRFQIFVDCHLHGLDSRVHRLPIEEAAAYVRKRNRVGKAVLKFAPSLWKRLFN
ncbi:hypothetical protein [Leisingera sp. M658]|uniref:hypothetical protein n=1 Tax=Leisingera sp. M658 TaxID=2867015 RepID=UPI0021A9743D|nr:hypothetical protein [Leisingera sp. M658]UWQ77427.1 hypothetical protein K3724_22880 [Leisingera sp. M658]